ncbi:sensory rhodopsin II [soil metagenome]
MNSRELFTWLYVAGMAAGVLLFWAWSRNPRGVPQYEYLIAMFIPVWSGLAYTAMALGQGQVEIAGQTTYFARYIDWTVTTPLLLLSLGLTAMFYVPKDKRQVSLLAGLVGADIVMILCGLVADLSSRPEVRFTWYGLGCVALIVVLWGIWGPLRTIAAAHGERLSKVYNGLALYLTVLWFGYPTVWLLGPSGLGVIDQTTDTLLFVVLPFFSKVVFSIFDLASLRRLEKTAEHRAMAHP